MDISINANILGPSNLKPIPLNPTQPQPPLNSTVNDENNCWNISDVWRQEHVASSKILVEDFFFYTFKVQTSLSENGQVTPLDFGQVHLYLHCIYKL